MQTLPSSGLHLRPVQDEDASFLFALFAETQDQLAALRADQALWRSLVEMQFRGRQSSFAALYPDAEDSVLEDENGEPVGRLLLDRPFARQGNPHANRWRIVDIALLTAARGHGLGTQVLQRLQDRAAACDAGLELQVDPTNPARRLYERLGFRTVSEDALAVQMVWSSLKDSPG
jgi:ribosomal protein S18 acetylase RimI-like enzyme